MIMRVARDVLPYLAAALAILGILSSAGQAKAEEDQSLLCFRATTEAEIQHRIPSQLLSALSVKETGRWDKERKEVIAWPWTVTNGGAGKHYPTKAAAIAAVKQLQAQGETNIDVGCMQVNLYYHPDAFDSLEEAFTPSINVAYAVQFLKGLRSEARTWTKTIAFYHSRTADLGQNYHAKVQQIWSKERKRAFKIRSLENKARNLARRASYLSQKIRQEGRKIS